MQSMNLLTKLSWTTRLRHSKLLLLSRMVCHFHFHRLHLGIMSSRKTTMAYFSSRKRKTTGPNYFSILPRDLTVNILSKLPSTSVLRCKVLCKEWFNIVTKDAIFAKIHYENNFMSLRCGVAIIDGYKTKSMNEQRGWSYKLEPHRFVGLWDRFEVANSCKGFLLMQEYSWCQKNLRTFGIYNPLTNETLFTPQLLMEKCITTCCALGFSPVTKQFKVVVFGNNDEQETYSLQIYTLEDGSAWRTVSLPEDWCHGGIFRHGFNYPVYLNGFVHWMATTETIACFDVEKEELGEMSTPPVEEFSANYMINMGEYKGLLCIEIPVYENKPRETEIWVLKEYGIRESWMRLVTVKHVLASNSVQDHPKSVFMLYRPKLVDILDSGEKIFVSVRTNQFHLLSYDPINECFEYLPFPAKYSGVLLNLDIYSPSFFRLKDIGNRFKLPSSVSS